MIELDREWYPDDELEQSQSRVVQQLKSIDSSKYLGKKKSKLYYLTLVSPMFAINQLSFSRCSRFCWWKISIWKNKIHQEHTPCLSRDTVSRRGVFCIGFHHWYPIFPWYAWPGRKWKTNSRRKRVQRENLQNKWG